MYINFSRQHEKTTVFCVDLRLGIFLTCFVKRKNQHVTSLFLVHPQHFFFWLWKWLRKLLSIHWRFLFIILYWKEVAFRLLKFERIIHSTILLLLEKKLDLRPVEKIRNFAKYFRKQCGLSSRYCWNLPRPIIGSKTFSLLNAFY